MEAELRSTAARASTSSPSCSRQLLAGNILQSAPPIQPIWPMLFVTIVCGAISGWHALFGLIAKRFFNSSTLARMRFRFLCKKVAQPQTVRFADER
jgi:carbon starvation protein CstA